MLHVVQTLDDALALKEWFGRQKTVALDTETTGLDLYSPRFRVRLIQFGNVNEAWVVPFDRWIGLIDELIQRFDGQFLLHNSPYDVEALRQCGVTIPWRKIDDTLVAMRLAEPHKPAALKSVAGRLVSKSAADSQTVLRKLMKKMKWEWDNIPIDLPEYVFYAAMDVILTSRIAEHPTCQAGFRSKVYGLEMDVREIASTMERNGMRVDVSFCNTTATRLREEAETLAAQAVSRYGIRLTSNAEVAHFLLENGTKLTRTTMGGAASVDKESLESAWLTAPKRCQDVIEMTLRLRKITKLASSYFDNFVSMSTDGLLHPSIETIAARTGRSSIRNPALQTLPRVSDDPDSRLVREAVIPRSPEHLLVSSDYDQIELRLIAALSKDPGLIEAFATSDSSGVDFFTASMRSVFADDALNKSDPRRNLIKTLMYASAYGAGTTKMAATAGVPVDEMRDISERVFKRFPGIKAMMKACQRAALENSNWIETPLGRRIWIDPEHGYKAMNGLIQGYAGDIFKQSMVNMAHAGLAEFFVVPVHDEMLLSVPWDILEDVRQVVADTMPFHDLPVPIPATPSDGVNSWAAAK